MKRVPFLFYDENAVPRGGLWVQHLVFVDRPIKFDRKNVLSRWCAGTAEVGVEDQYFPVGEPKLLV
jgi:hypothetical protein